MDNNELRSVLIEWFEDDEWVPMTLYDWLTDHHDVPHSQFTAVLFEMVDDGILITRLDGNMVLTEEYEGPHQDPYGSRRLDTKG